MTQQCSVHATLNESNMWMCRRFWIPFTVAVGIIMTFIYTIRGDSLNNACDYGDEDVRIRCNSLQYL